MSIINVSCQLDTVSESECPRLKDQQDEKRDFITNYQFPITYYQSQLDN